MRSNPSPAPPPAVERFTGAAIRPHLDAVAALRIAVFRDWPYLYEGDIAYEREYLDAYAASPGAVLVLARDGDAVVGASTGIPLAEDGDAFKAPFLARGNDAARGRGIGHAFFDAREAHARALGGFDRIAFAAVDRDDDDPRKPPGHLGNEAFWTKRGYVRQPGMTMRLHWNEAGRGEVEHALTFWLRQLDEAPTA